MNRQTRASLEYLPSYSVLVDGTFFGYNRLGIDEKVYICDMKQDVEILKAGNTGDIFKDVQNIANTQLRISSR